MGAFGKGGIDFFAECLYQGEALQPFFFCLGYPISLKLIQGIQPEAQIFS
jgi:hypothetical protein